MVKYLDSVETYSRCYFGRDSLALWPKVKSNISPRRFLAPKRHELVPWHVCFNCLQLTNGRPLIDEASYVQRGILGIAYRIVVPSSSSRESLRELFEVQGLRALPEPPLSEAQR